MFVFKPWLNRKYTKHPCTPLHPWNGCCRAYGVWFFFFGPPSASTPWPFPGVLLYYICVCLRSELVTGMPSCSAETRNLFHVALSWQSKPWHWWMAQRILPLEQIPTGEQMALPSFSFSRRHPWAFWVGTEMPSWGGLLHPTAHSANACAIMTSIIRCNNFLLLMPCWSAHTLPLFQLWMCQIHGIYTHTHIYI